MKEQSGQRFKVSLWRLILFQFKLAADAIRDFLLSPISIILFIIDVVLKPDREDSYFEKLMRAGRHSDRLINLFDEYTEEDRFAPFDHQDAGFKPPENKNSD